MTHDPFTIPTKTSNKPKRPILSLVESGKKVEKKELALTAKQQAFLTGVTVDRLTASDAYRASYDASRSSARSIHTRASELMAHSVIASRIKAYWQAEERGRQSDAASKGRWIIQQLEDIVADPKCTHASKVRALELLGKQRDVGLFVDRSVDETNIDNRTSAQVRQELEQQLGRLLGESTA